MHGARRRRAGAFLHGGRGRRRGADRDDAGGTGTGWDAASAAAGVPRASGIPVRLLHAGDDHVGLGAAGGRPGSRRGGNRRRAGRKRVPLLRLSADRPGGAPGRGVAGRADRLAAGAAGAVIRPTGAAVGSRFGRRARLVCGAAGRPRGHGRARAHGGELDDELGRLAPRRLSTGPSPPSPARSTSVRATVRRCRCSSLRSSERRSTQ